MIHSVAVAVKKLREECLHSQSWFGESETVDTNAGQVEVTAKMVVNNLSRTGLGNNFVRMSYKLNGKTISAKKLEEILALFH